MDIFRKGVGSQPKIGMNILLASEKSSEYRQKSRRQVMWTCEHTATGNSGNTKYNGSDAESQPKVNNGFCAIFVVFRKAKVKWQNKFVLIICFAIVQ